MRTRILLTDGVKTADIFWLTHTGTDVYCGIPKFALKRSFHQSGKVHSYTDQGRTDESVTVPLKEISCQFHLNALVFDPKSLLAGMYSRSPYSGKRSEAVLWIDVRAIPPEVQVQVSVGHLEPGAFDALRLLVELPSAVPEMRMVVNQVHLATSVNPWIYLIVYWQSLDA